MKGSARKKRTPDRMKSFLRSMPRPKVEWGKGYARTFLKINLPTGAESP
jgi:hypothetical protein